MAATTTLNGPRHAPASGGPPKSLVILLHGLGADGNDLIGLAPHWAHLLPDAAFVSPHAPFPCDMAPMGRQWFSLRDASPAAMARGVEQAAPILDAFIDAELENAGLTDDRLALVGFSQGTMMSLHVSLRRTRACAGVLGYSGMLVAPETLKSDIHARPPIMLIHGDRDELIPVDALHGAVSVLAEAGASAQWHVCEGLGHGIDETGLDLGGKFLKGCLGS
ncbi:MAG: phospholipase [Rhodospirillaceae bacterium]|nr:phospholipase [Rhodospirillaceae bacterium]